MFHTLEIACYSKKRLGGGMKYILGSSQKNVIIDTDLVMFMSDITEAGNLTQNNKIYITFLIYIPYWYRRKHTCNIVAKSNGTEGHKGIIYTVDEGPVGLYIIEYQGR